MPARAKLPDVDTLVRLRAKHRRNEEHPGDCHAGHTLAEVAAIYDVTVKAVYLKLRAAGLTSVRPRYTETLPWKVSSAHEQDWTAHMLRELAKRNAGLEPGQRAQYLDAWLVELDAKDHVIAYDPEKGFHRVKRRAGECGYTRQPKRTRTATR